eukprot:763996-Hanusia_phi.AAC.2
MGREASHVCILPAGVFHAEARRKEKELLELRLAVVVVAVAAAAAAAAAAAGMDWTINQKVTTANLWYLLPPPSPCALSNSCLPNGEGAGMEGEEAGA